MIDGIKFKLNPDAVRTSDILEFRRINSTRETAKYNGLIVELYPETCFVRGSIHKYKNKGLHNADDFKLSDFTQTLNDLSATFNFNPEATTFHSLEFGINIKPAFDPQDFINSIVYCNKGKIDKSPNGVIIRFAEYDIKIYIKKVKTQSGKFETVLRYEIRINKMRRLHNIIKKDGVFCSTLADLSKPALWRLLGNELLNIYDSILIVEHGSVDTSSLNTDEIRLFIDGCHSWHWSQQWADRMKKKRTLEKFQNIIKNHSTSTLKNDIRNLIDEKINSLINIQDVTKSPFAKHNKGVDLSKNHRCAKNVKTTIQFVQKSSFEITGKRAKMLRNHRLDNGGFCNTCDTKKISGDFVPIGYKNHHRPKWLLSCQTIRPP